MRRIIWTCWFQGRSSAPELVRKCLNSWEERNPGWEVRCLDAFTTLRYAPALADFDLSARTVTAASLSDVLRISLLHEFGGVWVDATLFCNRPLDDWLPEVFGEGFFAFDRPGPDRPSCQAGSWLAEPGHPTIAAWARAVDSYWSERSEVDEYFWFHQNSFRKFRRPICWLAGPGNGCQKCRPMDLIESSISACRAPRTRRRERWTGRRQSSS